MPNFDWDSLKEIIPSREARPPEQSFTRREFMEKRGVTSGSAKHTLHGLVDSGQLISDTFWAPELSLWITYYWRPTK